MAKSFRTHGRERTEWSRLFLRLCTHAICQNVFRTEFELNELQKCSMSVSNISRAASTMKNPRFGFDVYSMDFW